MKKKGYTTANNHKRLVSWLHGFELILVQSSICLIVLLSALITMPITSGRHRQSLKQTIDQGLYEHHMLSSPSDGETLPLSATETTAPTTALSVSAVSYTVAPPFSGGVLTSAYGERVDPITGQSQSFHDGVDIAMPGGTQIHAFMNGTVIEKGYEENGYGWYVLVACDTNHQYLYAHCLEVTVDLHQEIVAGDVIATVGSTGRSTGDHLHFEWRENGKAVDPMTVLPKETYAAM